MTPEQYEIFADVVSGITWRSRDTPAEAVLRASTVADSWYIVHMLKGTPHLPSEAEDMAVVRARMKRNECEWPKDRKKIPPGSTAEKLTLWHEKNMERSTSRPASNLAPTPMALPPPMKGWNPKEESPALRILRAKLDVQENRLLDGQIETNGLAWANANTAAIWEQVEYVRQL